MLPPTTPAASSQILRFELSGGQYAFDVLKAREVLTMVPITPLPSSLEFLSGVINLRGSVIPVVDAVRGVSHCETAELEAAPRFGMQLNANLIQAIAKKDGEFIIILDADKVFSENELWVLQNPAGAEAK